MKRIPIKLIAAVKRIQERFTELNDTIVFCGSLGLYLHKLIDRVPHDIDCITGRNYYGVEGYEHLNHEGSGKFIVNGKLVECVHGHFEHYHVDFFYITNYEPELCAKKMNFYGTTILVEKPEYALEAKISYIANLEPHREGYVDPHRDKHEADIKLITKRLKTR